jgi:hypothetical protein
MRRDITNRRVLKIALLATLCAVLLAPAMALARAGGGHISFGGSSGGGGGSFGGGGGGFLGGFFLGSGGDGVFWTIVAIYLVYRAIKWFYDSRDMSRGASPADRPGNVPLSSPVNFDALRADDPNFSEQAFYGRVNEMFLAIQKAWEARSMEPARRFLSQEQFQVLADGVGEYVRNGQINKLDSIHVDRVEPTKVMREGGSDYVTTLITASVIDYTVDERTGQLVNPGVLGDGKTVKTFQEYWTLVRRQGAQTKADATIKKCPNCGAPVTDGNYVKCAYCGSMMNDPALDWVLLRIEQVD